MKKFLIEYSWLLVLCVGYLLSDNLHMVFSATKSAEGELIYNYELGDIISNFIGSPLNPKYTLQDSFYYPLKYLFGSSALLSYYVFRIQIKTKQNPNKIAIAFCLFIVCMRDFVGDLLEAMGVFVPFLGNYDYNNGYIVKITFIFGIIILSFMMRKRWKKLLLMPD